MIPILLVAAQSWPMFRANTAATGATSVVIGTQLYEKWSVEFDGAVASTPAVQNGIVYVASMDGTVTALNLRDGKKRWSFRSPSAFSASPTLYGDRIYLGDEGGVFYCLSKADGKKRWEFETGDKIVSSALPWNGRIIFGSYDSRIYALDTRGKLRWKATTKAQVHATPVLCGNRIAALGCDGILRLLDPQTGKSVKTIPVGGNTSGTPAYGDGTLFTANTRAEYCAIDNRVRWRLREKEEGATCFASPAYVRGLVLFASRSRRVFALDAKTGKLKWTFKTRQAVDSAPVVSGSVALFGSDEGYLYAVDILTGKRITAWHLGGKLRGAPAIAEGCLLIGGEDGVLHCLAKK